MKQGVFQEIFKQAGDGCYCLNYLSGCSGLLVSKVGDPKKWECSECGASVIVNEDEITLNFSSNDYKSLEKEDITYEW